MKTKSIYPASNSLRLKKIMAKYSPSEILYVPIEVAKYNHKACCVNFFGDILTPAFEFPNNSHGIDFFILKITGVARTSKIKKILTGLESTGHYHRNLTLRLKVLGFDVAVINPFDSWKERLNKNAKTDKIDLGSIAKALISGKFSSSYMLGGIYYNLRRVTRTRRKFISRRISSQNVITGLLNRLFPGLWDEDDSIFSERWGKGSLLVIERYSTPQRILRLGENRLARFLRKNQTGEYDPEGLPVSKKGNKFLRTSLNQAALSLNTWCPDFNAYYTRKLIEKADKKGTARTATGNKLARLAFALTKHEMLYRPRTLDSLTSNLKDYYIGLYGKILKKLDRFSSEKILPTDNYLEQIKRKLEKQYAVNLSKLSESI